MAKVCLYTMAQQDPETQVYVGLVNGNNEIGWRLEQVNENTVVVDEDVERSKDPAVDYCRVMEHRMPMVLDILRMDYEQVGFFDSDIIVRQPLHDLWANADHGTLSVWYRPEQEPHRYFQAGVHILGNSPEIREYYADVINKASHWKNKYATQAQLWTSYEERKEKIRLINIGEKYNDKHFQKDSCIWHCKGSHFKEKKWQKEFQHYLKLANRLYNVG